MDAIYSRYEYIICPFNGTPLTDLAAALIMILYCSYLSYWLYSDVPDGAMEYISFYLITESNGSPIGFLFKYSVNCRNGNACRVSLYTHINAGIIYANAYTDCNWWVCLSKLTNDVILYSLTPLEVLYSSNELIRNTRYIAILSSDVQSMNNILLPSTLTGVLYIHTPWCPNLVLPVIFSI